MGVPLEADAFVAHVSQLLENIQENLFAQAEAFRDSSIRDVSSYEELKAAVAEGYWARGPWAGEVQHNENTRE